MNIVIFRVKWQSCAICLTICEFYSDKYLHAFILLLLKKKNLEVGTYWNVKQINSFVFVSTISSNQRELLRIK